MSAVIYTRPPNRLGKLLAAPGGRKLSDAVSEAQANLDSIRDQVTGEVDVALSRLRESVAAASMVDGGAEARADVYAHATAIAGLAGLCGLGQLGQVAYNLCELADCYIERQAWNSAAVAAHLDTMTLLRMAGLPDGSPEGVALLEGLKSLVRRVDASAGGPGLDQDAPL
ncbi:MAG: hypothetical protein GC203_14530 [Phenylobacterium sp.]|uniref:hypothetical protein n=1 Tax=Phenylobacterium sp. TaxID=1871053 RepID=UPI0025E8FC3E|nr:hypothetical protein [Phenylobacterium sp.]MBI1199072.1 hypothetical protein [Phenylobacterium sp.]